MRNCITRRYKEILELLTRICISYPRYLRGEVFHTWATYEEMCFIHMVISYDSYGMHSMDIAYPSCSNINLLTGSRIRVLCLATSPVLNLNFKFSWRSISSLTLPHPFAQSAFGWKLLLPFYPLQSSHRPYANPPLLPGQFNISTKFLVLRTLYIYSYHLICWSKRCFLTLPLWVKRETRGWGSCWRAGGRPPRKHTYRNFFILTPNKYEYLVRLNVLPGWTVLSSSPWQFRIYSFGDLFSGINDLFLGTDEGNLVTFALTLPMNWSSPPSTGFSRSHSWPHCFCKLPSLDISFPAFKGSSFPSLSTCPPWVTMLKNQMHDKYQGASKTTCLLSQRGDVMRRQETRRRKGKAGRRIICLYTPISTIKPIQGKCFAWTQVHHYFLTFSSGRTLFIVLGGGSQLSGVTDFMND